MATKTVSPLQALVIADSFDEYFRPITLEQPRALLPIAGIPLLNYTIEFLASSGVREIYVLCRAHADALETHIKSLKGKIGVEVKCLKVPGSQNVGDALREVAEEDFLQQDFVLVYGDIVSNQKLRPIVQEHVLRREKDKNVLMTLLLTKTVEDQELAKLKIPMLNTLFTASGSQASANSTVPSTSVTPHVSSILPNDTIDLIETDLGASNSSHSSRTPATQRASVSSTIPLMSSSPGTSVSFMENAAAAALSLDKAAASSNAARLSDSPVYLTLTSNESKLVIMDDESCQVFLYEDRSVTHQSPHVELDMTLFKKHRHILVRNDLQDSGVAICSPDVLIKFKDHFDYKNLSQLVRGVINDELQELTVYAAIGDPHSYTNRASNLRHYHQVTMDVLRRWAFPLVPETNVLPGSTWSYSRPCIYKERHVQLHRDCKVNSNCAIGAGSSLSSGVVVGQSTIGRSCKIGRNVRINHCFIWDNVTIDDDCVLDHAILCSGSSIGKGTIVSSGCIVGYNVAVGPGQILPALTKLTAYGLQAMTPSQNREDKDDFGEAYSDDEDMSDTEESEGAKRNNVLSNIRDIDLGVGGAGRKWVSPPIPFSELHTGWETVNHIRDALASMQNARGTESQSLGQKTHGTGTGADEDVVTDLEAFNREVESIALTYCKDLKKDVHQLILEVNSLKFAHDRSFLDCLTAIFTTIMAQVDRGAIMRSLLVFLKRFKPVFLAFLPEEQHEFIFVLEEYCEEESNEAFAKQFTNILNKLYELEILKEQAFLDWAEEHEEDAEEEASELYKAAKSFIAWLQASSEEEESEEDDE